VAYVLGVCAWEWFLSELFCQTFVENESWNCMVELFMCSLCGCLRYFCI
jgi:hypothetical protein